MKAYVATGLGNAEAAKAMAAAMEKHNYEIAYAWWVHGSVQDQGEARIRSVASVEAAAVAESKVVIAILPGGRGTHTEFGMALAQGKHIYIVDMEGGNFNTSPTPEKRTCCFYFMPNVVRINARNKAFQQGDNTPWRLIAKLIVESEANYARLVAAFRKGG